MARINVGGCRVEERGVARKQLPYPPICCVALFCYILEHIYFRHLSWDILQFAQFEKLFRFNHETMFNFFLLGSDRSELKSLVFNN